MALKKEREKERTWGRRSTSSVRDKSYRDKGCVDKEIQKFRRSGVRRRGQGVADKGFINKEFGVQGGVDKEFIGKDFVDKKSSSRRRSA